MFSPLRHLHAQVLQALEHNARAASILLELAIRRPPDTIRTAQDGPVRSDSPLPVSLQQG